MGWKSRGWVLFACALLQACGTSPRPASPRSQPSCQVPNEVQLEIEASDRVNVDETGRSLPTRLRLYQVSDLSRLEQASFDDVWSRPQEVLGSSALSTQELVIYPGQVLVHRFKRNDKADYVVAVAVFREPEGEAWRTAQEWPLPGDPCQSPGARNTPKLAKLRVRMFLEDNHIESLNNYAALPRRQCSNRSTNCAERPGGNRLQRNLRLQSFEENPHEPEVNAE